MNRKFMAWVGFVLVMAVALSGCGSKSVKGTAPGEKVTIEYWQYYYESKKNLMDELITEFQAKNPNIEVKQVTFPYEQYNEKVAATVSAGRGPDVINLYYGWLPKYVDSGYLQPLPEKEFPASMIEKDFFPIAKSGNLNGKYYVLPTAVRTLALLYNKELFKAANIQSPPKTWEELVADGKLLTKRDATGKLEQVGFYFNTGGQGHNWYREVLVRQEGGTPYSADNKKTTYTSEAGQKAFQWWTELQTVQKVGEIGFMTDDVTAFKAGKAAMDVDGSFRLGNLKDATFDFASAPLPLGPNGKPYTMGSYWANGITKKATGAKFDAATKFLQFLTTADVMERWTKATGELPARPEVADKFKSDPKLAGFIEGLPYAYATFFVDETKQRQTLLDGVDEVILNKVDPKVALENAAKKDQALLDEYWSKHQ
jgi:multiple sugar transport system substrate-binding protein